jgi:hypothetical protein
LEISKAGWLIERLDIESQYHYNQLYRFCSKQSAAGTKGKHRSTILQRLLACRQT